jgi:hypothetical protein
MVPGNPSVPGQLAAATISARWSFTLVSTPRAQDPTPGANYSLTAKNPAEAKEPLEALAFLK